MQKVPTWRLAPAVLILVILGLFAGPVFGEVDGATDADFVFEICNNLESNYYDPEAIQYPALLNQALMGVADILKKGGADFIFKTIPDSAGKETAKNLFRQKMEKAAIFAQTKGGFQENDLAFAAAARLLESLKSSHTGFLTPEENQERMSELSGRNSFVGVGMMIEALEDDFIYIRHVFDGAPAQKAGLQRFDRIIAVDGKAITKDLKEVVSWIRGKPGEVVTITVERQRQRLEFKIKRAGITAPTFNGKVLEENGKKIGYLALYGFNEGASGLVKDFLLQNNAIDGWILDLRGNPGGYVDELMSITEYFLPAKTLVFYSKDKQSKKDYYTNDENIPLTKKSVIVLIDKGSASASEITAGGLKDSQRAIIVGVNSAGGTEVGVQQLLSRGAAMSVAIKQVFTPKGLNIENNGIPPDEEVKMTKEDILQNKDKQLGKALEMLSK